MKITVTIDVPDLEKGLRFYEDAFGFVVTARPIPSDAILTCDGVEIGLMETAEGTKPGARRARPAAL